MRRILTALLLTLAVIAVGTLGGCHDYAHVGYGGYYGYGYDGGHHGGDHHGGHRGGGHRGGHGGGHYGGGGGGHCDY